MKFAVFATILALVTLGPVRAGAQEEIPVGSPPMPPPEWGIGEPEFPATVAVAPPPAPRLPETE